MGLEESAVNNMKPSTIGLVVAAVIFLIAAIGINVGSISLVALGLAVLAGSFALEKWKM
jgi:hypothetical protein